MKNNKIKVILLVAGEGKRLRPFTLDRPKCMVEIDDVSLLDYQLGILKSEGLVNVVMIGGYKSEMLIRNGVKFKNNPRWYETNMVWTLFCAEDELEGDVIVSYGDIVYSRNILKELLNSTADIAVTIDKDWESYWRARNDNPLDDAETLKLGKDGLIIEIGKKPKSLDEIEGQYMGLMKFSAAGIRQIKSVYHDAQKSGKLLGKPTENAYMTDLLQAIIQTGKPISSVPIQGNWIEVDTVEDLQSNVTLSRLKELQKI